MHNLLAGQSIGVVLASRLRVRSTESNRVAHGDRTMSLAELSVDCESVGCFREPVGTLSWAREVAQRLADGAQGPPNELPKTLPACLAAKLLRLLQVKLKQEPTLLELHPEENVTVNTCGDLHGQFPDLQRIFSLAGEPSPINWYIFAGDFVDRGAWGLETLLLLAAWKLAAPNSVFLLRGDHEAISPSTFYGFKAELAAKYGKPGYKQVYRPFKSMCEELPLAATVAGKALIVHGGLWRDPDHPGDLKQQRLRVGRLEHLRAASKGGRDPDPSSPGAGVASDLLWSDPHSSPGMRPNKGRGQGTVWGPDVTETFLNVNRLQLIVRGHESPDARAERTRSSRGSRRNRLPPLVDGYSVDHISKRGMLVTVFSAPAYPMFTSSTNPAAVLRMSGPTWCKPKALTFEAAPRPNPAGMTQMFSFDDQADLCDSDPELAGVVMERVQSLKLHDEGIPFDDDASVTVVSSSPDSLAARSSPQGGSPMAPQVVASSPPLKPSPLQRPPHPQRKTAEPQHKQGVHNYYAAVPDLGKDSSERKAAVPPPPGVGTAADRLPMAHVGAMCSSTEAPQRAADVLARSKEAGAHRHARGGHAVKAGKGGKDHCILM